MARLLWLFCRRLRRGFACYITWIWLEGKSLDRYRRSNSGQPHFGCFSMWPRSNDFQRGKKYRLGYRFSILSPDTGKQQQTEKSCAKHNMTLDRVHQARQSSDELVAEKKELSSLHFTFFLQQASVLVVVSWSRFYVWNKMLLIIFKSIMLRCGWIVFIRRSHNRQPMSTKGANVSQQWRQLGMWCERQKCGEIGGKGRKYASRNGSSYMQRA